MRHSYLETEKTGLLLFVALKTCSQLFRTSNKLITAILMLKKLVNSYSEAEKLDHSYFEQEKIETQLFRD